MELLNNYKCLSYPSKDSQPLKPVRSSRLKSKNLSKHSRQETEQDFAELTSLMCLLGPLAGVNTCRSETGIEGETTDFVSEATQKRWHRLLDNLAWLADSQIGGTSVTTITARVISYDRANTSITYLVSGNHPIVDDTLGHLTSILSDVEKLSQDIDAESLPDKLETLAQKCVNFSSQKAKNYAKRLIATIGDLESLTAQAASDSGTPEFSSLSKFDGSTPLSPEDQFVQDLKQLQSTGDDYMKMCSLAHKFRLSSSLEALEKRCEGSMCVAIWKSIHHFIGRLGSWHKSVRVLVHVFKKEPIFTTDFNVQAIPHSFLHNHRYDRKPGLDLALSRHCTEVPGRHVIELLEARLKPWHSTVKAAYSDYHGKFMASTMVHAELRMLSYINDDPGFAFAFNSRYIGCSKRLCYLCDLYFKFHPGCFRSRPSHGKIYCNWRWPDDAHTIMIGDQSILQIISRYMRNDFPGQIISSVRQIGQDFDSSNAMSRSMMSRSQNKQ